MMLAAQAALAQAVPSLLIPADARALAMGGVAQPKNASTLDIQGFYGMWAPKSAGSSVFGGEAFTRVSDRVALSVEGRFFAHKPYDVTTPQGQVTGSFTPGDFFAGAGVALDFTKAFGATLKARYVSSAVAADARGSASALIFPLITRAPSPSLRRACAISAPGSITVALLTRCRHWPLSAAGSDRWTG